MVSMRDAEALVLTAILGADTTGSFAAAFAGGFGSALIGANGTWVAGEVSACGVDFSTAD